MGSTANAPQSTLDTQERFLAAHGWQNALRSALPGDFSARYYVRLSEVNRKALLMVMPNASELTPFLSMQAALAGAGVRVPAVYAYDAATGLALIEDLGTQDFTSLLRTAPSSVMPAKQLYTIAVDALLQLHHAPVVDEGLTRFTPQLFLEQVGLFLDNYAAHVIKMPFSTSARTSFITAWLPALEYACAIPSALMLRDYHAANIMYHAQEEGHRKAALIDFQDGGIGPISYDLASLLEDARLDVPADLRNDMLNYYLKASPFKNHAAFMTSYHILACQRHMRILGILAKRWAGGSFPVTGEYFKRVWKLIMLHREEAALAPVYEWLDHFVAPQFRGEWHPPENKNHE